MIKRTTKFLLTIATICGLNQAFGTDIYPFFLERPDGSLLEGYLTPPSDSDSPIVFAIQGSSCESVLQWHTRLSEQASDLGLGVIALEKQGVSRQSIDLPTYYQTNCLQQRKEDYALCLANLNLICPGWQGKTVFWGESEGGMIAAHLASETPNTAAVLLFGAGGGMKSREEVKWALQHRLQQQGAEQDEIETYMLFLNAQMDEMIRDPNTDEQFLGNTYKWWASFLTAEEGANALSRQSLPICLIHGTEDMKVPVQSADLAAETLSKTNTLTYLRLEGYGHNLDTTAVQDLAHRWLEAVLFGGEPMSDANIAQAIASAPTSSQNPQISLSEYIFSRGGDDGDTKNDVSVSSRADRDSDGRESASVDLQYKRDLGNGVVLEGKAGGSVSKDKEGNVKGETHAEVRASVKY